MGAGNQTAAVTLVERSTCYVFGLEAVRFCGEDSDSREHAP